VSSPARRREEAKSARAYTDIVHTSPAVSEDQRAPLRADAHGKCRVCGSTVMTAQEWWLYGHGLGRCLRQRSTIGIDEFNALFSNGGERI
jgi:hypothetical protein